MTTNAKNFLCLALVLGNCIFSCAGTNAIAATNFPAVKVFSPQESVYLPGFGPALLCQQSWGFSLQVPVGGEKGGPPKLPISNTNKVQAWLLKTDATAVQQSSKPSLINLWGIADLSEDYQFYSFAKVPVNELAGVVVSLNGKLYCHLIETNDHGPSIVPPDGNLVQISPTNISQSPLSVQVTNFDNYEHINVDYKTDKMVFDKFLTAYGELSDGDAVISSEPVKGVWTTNGVTFKFGGGYVWPYKFKIIEKNHRGEAAMPGYSGYWFYERDFATNLPIRNEIQVYNGGETTVLQIPGLNEPIDLTTQSRQYTIQLEIADYPISGFSGFRPMHKVSELHRQAWLLRADGTIFPARPPQHGGVGNGGWESERLIFQFPRKEGDDAVGAAVSIGGNLYCHALK